MIELATAVLTGRDDSCIDHQALERPVHREVVVAWRALQADARAAGFELALASGYRDYDRQLTIWNEKVAGVRPVMDDAGRVLDVARVAPAELMWAILRWSALPGASRHHWGTDVDVYDRAAVPAHYRLQLTPAEAGEAGPFGPLHRWLDERIAANASHGFFRPYANDRGGVAPERWHLSYAPLAVRYQRALTAARLWSALDAPSLLLRDTVAERWPAVYRRFIAVPAACYPDPWRTCLSELSDDLSGDDALGGQHREPLQ